MKNFLTNFVFVALAAAAGFLGVRLVNSQMEVRRLTERVKDLEAAQTGLAQEIAALTNQTETVVNPSDVLAEVEQQVAAARWTEFKEAIVYKTVPAAELLTLYQEDVRARWHADEARDKARALAALGLLPLGTDLVAIWSQLFDDEGGVYYRWQDKTVYLSDRFAPTNGRQRLALARELSIVLKHQNPDLAELFQPAADDDDRNLAAAAFLEGDAILVLNRLPVDRARRSSHVMDLAGVTGRLEAKLGRVSPSWRRVLQFPEQEGVRCLTLLEDRMRTRLIPPLTTEQVLHPEKSRMLSDTLADDPTPLTLAVVDSTTWRLLANNVLGEFGMTQMFMTRLRKQEAELSAQGWDGDRYHVYERGINGPVGIVWRTVWDTKLDAEEFEEAYVAFARKHRRPAHVVRDGVYVTIVQSDDPAFDELAQDALRRSGVTVVSPATAP